ncbi:MAG: S4 domain-containing protein, partial [Patescibacteria group bacterium]
LEASKFSLSREDKRLLLGTALTIELSRKAFSEGILFVDFLTEKGIMFSKREAREFIQNGAITLNDEKITDLGFRLVLKNLPEELSLIRKGKKEVFILSY